MQDPLLVESVFDLLQLHHLKTSHERTSWRRRASLWCHGSGISPAHLLFVEDLHGVVLPGLSVSDQHHATERARAQSLQPVEVLQTRCVLRDRPTFKTRLLSRFNMLWVALQHISVSIHFASFRKNYRFWYFDFDLTFMVCILYFCYDNFEVCFLSFCCF